VGTQTSENRKIQREKKINDEEGGIDVPNLGSIVFGKTFLELKTLEKKHSNQKKCHRERRDKRKKGLRNSRSQKLKRESFIALNFPVSLRADRTKKRGIRNWKGERCRKKGWHRRAERRRGQFQQSPVGGSGFNWVCTKGN